MRMRNNRFLIMIGVPLLILLGLTFKPLSAHYFGDEVMLKTQPVDPTDLLYGDYAALNLEINDIPHDRVDKEVFAELSRKEEQSPLYGGNLTVYTILDQNGEAEKTVLSEPEDGIYLKGRVAYYDEQQYIHVDYGLNRFYVEEGSGTEIEELAAEGDVIVSVRIKDGYGIMKELKKKP